jgi:hypothetical protein
MQLCCTFVLGTRLSGEVGREGPVEGVAVGRRVGVGKTGGVLGYKCWSDGNVLG